MKLLALILVLLVSACGSWGNRKFKRKHVCSEASLTYLKEHKATYVKNDSKRVKKKVAKIEEEVKACYKQELKHAWGKPSFNLCLVAGYDAEGKMEHFEFSSREYSMSSAMVKCLSVIKTNKGLKGPKNIAFIQPYRLSPKKK